MYTVCVKGILIGMGRVWFKEIHIYTV